MGPGLVHHLSGSEYAKERLEAILETIAGNLTVAQACERIGIGEAMFHRLRTRVLQVGLSDLEPRTAGRPRREMSQAEQEKEQLAAKVEALEDELKIMEVRHELATILPAVAEKETFNEADVASAPKKTTAKMRKQRRSRLRKRTRRR